MSVEETANTLTHGFGLVLSTLGLIFLTTLAASTGDVWYIISAVMYGLSLMALYGASTFYHGATSEALKKRLQLIDHCCIYLLIAGTYTPFTLITLRGSFGNSLFIVVWAFAIIGIAMKVFLHDRIPAASVVSYLVMGWIGIVAVQPIYAAIGLVPIALVVAGGLIYSLGTVFYAWKSLKHHHAIWHLFVLGGSICHFVAIALYIFPYMTNL